MHAYDNAAKADNDLTFPPGNVPADQHLQAVQARALVSIAQSLAEISTKMDRLLDQA